ncbi:TolC family protein [Gillisia limnaea]|uniref:Outer membrane efflux protein n=1 Tax=Gillisia limnaea (strain DSM 15749 / LMG 21470 / R-8282) TaxID=865937 RepID=H2BXN7_GILLR|nr:TolC family protein [Gillisia limnaea]EHQ03161.1 outer membrane efflux protein [Gillisia limnaea DSM 15749]
MRTFIIITSFLLSIQLYSQDIPSEKLSLKESIEIALKNNINLKRSHLQAETAELNFRGTRSEVLPNLNGRYNYGVNNGRSIDPFTNDFIDQKLNFSNASLSLNTQIFNGFELRNSIQRDRFSMKASEAEAEAERQQLILEVTLAYFQVLNNQDLLELARLRLESTKQQTDRLKILNEQGQGNPADYTDIKGQVNNDQSIAVDAKNNLYQSKLVLAQLLNVDSEIDIEDFQASSEMEKYRLTPEETYEASLENLATFEGKRLRIQAAEEDIAVSRSLFAPDISFFAQLNTNYSSVASLFNETGTQIVETGQFITVDDVTYPVITNQSQFAEEKISYSDQFENNLNSVVGVAVDIPIFNGFRAKRNVQLKKIQLEDAELELENTKNQFLQAIKSAHNDMEAAYENYFILQDQVDAYEESYEVNEIRFTNGVSNIVEFIISKNNLDRARINLANAKYEYLIRVKVLDYYKGEPI